MYYPIDISVLWRHLSLFAYVLDLLRNVAFLRRRELLKACSGWLDVSILDILYSVWMPVWGADTWVAGPLLCDCGLVLHPDLYSFFECFTGTSLFAVRISSWQISNKTLPYLRHHP
jgi:hypothetical protein